MKIDAVRWARRPAFWLGLPLAAWTLYWATVAWGDVRAETTLGQGAALGDLAAHEVFQFLFVAAHGGVRWMAGVVALPAIGLALFLWRRLRIPERTRSPGEPLPVSGD